MAENFYIQKGGYLQFDAVTIEQYIKDVLNIKANDSQFTDQNFDGSYFSTIIEVISYTFNVLMFYLNQTSSESMFTDAELYENMNRIVKMLGYNPVGYQTSIVPYQASAPDLESHSVYNIPRYSYINAGGTTYSFAKDLVFKGDSISTNVDELVLYQGKFYEYPIYEAGGVGNEVIFLAPGNNVIIDYFNIDVYIKGKSGGWNRWNRVESLTTEDASSKSFEVRFNENYNYELTFGDNINGRSLALEDHVAIYYLQSDGKGNEISIGDLGDLATRKGPKYVRFSSPRFTEIFADLTSSINIGDTVKPEDITFSNKVPSSQFNEPETVDEMRQNAPFVLKEKNTLATASDYARFIKRSFSNIASDVSVVDNWEYAKTYLKYFHDLGIDNIQNVSRILYNQVMFADSCNFNNVYAFIKPEIASGSSDFNSFLSPSFKQLIINEVSKLKLITSEVVVLDPVYMAVDIGINDLSTDITPSDSANTELVIIKDKNSFRTDDAIISDVYQVFTDYFDQGSVGFESTISFVTLTDSIQAIDGVVNFKTGRTDSDISYDGLSLISWNPVYPADVTLVLRDLTYKFFQIPYLHNRVLFIEKLRVEVES